MEKNKQWTREPLLPPVYIKDYKGTIIGEEEAADVVAKSLAKSKMKNIKEVVDAINDEEHRDAKRKEAEDNCTTAKKLKELIKKHEKERHDHRTYLRTLQYNNDIIMISKMGKYGILW